MAINKKGTKSKLGKDANKGAKDANKGKPKDKATKAIKRVVKDNSPFHFG
jgi:hypothetical protein